MNPVTDRPQAPGGRLWRQLPGSIRCQLILGPLIAIGTSALAFYTPLTGTPPSTLTTWLSGVLSGCTGSLYARLWWWVLQPTRGGLTR